MFLKNIQIDNTGPIDHLSIDFPRTADGLPKPLVIVGENGAGKTILLSHIVNSLIAAQQATYDDAEVEAGKVYKYRSPAYIKSGSNYAFARIDYDSDQFLEEWQLNVKRSDFESTLGFSPARQSWTSIPQDTHSHFATSFNHNTPGAKALFDKKCCLYFPVNRFEEPAWLNEDNLKGRASYTEIKHIERISNRTFISTSPLKQNRNWLLDLLLDRHVLEMDLITFANGQALPFKIFNGWTGDGSRIYEAVTQLLRTTLRADQSVRLGVGNRRNRIISILKDEKPWVPNLFQLSTGEVLLLNLFLSIIRDFDLAGGSVDTLNSIEGIVIVDEIDAHLHAVHQREVLPNLIAAFPKVQFVLTTHSPLFLLGMREKFGEDDFQIVSMPTGSRLSAMDFSELSAAYDAFRKTDQHRQEIQKVLLEKAQPIVFVEGDYDIRYINKAAELLGKQDVLSAVQLKDGSGYGNLDKIWKSYDTSMAEVLPQRVLLLYDCDTQKAAADRGMVLKRVIPSIAANPIAIGIENLFPEQLIDKLVATHEQFIDMTAPVQKRVRGQLLNMPAQMMVNKDEKGNMCNWLCANGTLDDFQNFAHIFDLIEQVL
jgi:hypothetical protein